MFFQLLKNKNFMLLWIAQTMTQLEATIVDFTIAVVFADAVKTNHLFGESATALVFALQFIPALPTALLAGVVADIVDRRILMLASNIFRSAFLLLFVFASDPGVHLYLFVLVMAVCMHSYDVFEKSTIRNVTNEKEIATANGLFIFTMNATTLVGVIAAGFLKEAIGLQAVLLSGAILYAIAAVLIFKLPKNINNFQTDHYVEDKNVVIDTQKAFKRLYKSIKETIKYTKNNPPVWLAVILATVVQTTMLVVASISFRYGSDVLNINSSQVSIFLLIPVALGLAFGAVFLPVLTRIIKYKSVVLVSWLTGSVLLAVIGGIGFLPMQPIPTFTFEFIVFEILLLIMGGAITLIQAPALEIIQRFAEPKIRGRVFGVLVGATNTISGILVALSGILLDALRANKSDVLGIPKFMIVYAVILLVSMLIYSWLINKVLKGKDYVDYQPDVQDVSNVSLKA